MTALYRFYGADGRLLYVGITENWKRRRYHHKVNAPWFGGAVQLTVEHFDNRRLAETAEVEAIRSEWPLWNQKDSPYRNLAERLARGNARRMPTRVVVRSPGVKSPKADAYLKKLLATAPPLTPEQRSALAAILRPSASGAIGDD